MRPKLTSVKPQNGFKLELLYSNGERRVYDASTLLCDPKNKPLSNEAVFSTAKVCGCGIEWANGIDVCPDELYSNSKSCASLQLR